AIILPRAAATTTGATGRDWPIYGGGSSGTRYSPLKQINRSNVAQLTVAWTLDTADGAGASQTQTIVVDGVLYGLTPKHKVIALDGASGKELWQLDQGTPGRGPNRSPGGFCRSAREYLGQRGQKPLECSWYMEYRPFPASGVQADGIPDAAVPMGGVRFLQYYDARGAGFCSWRTEFREDCHSYGKPTAADRAENSLLNFVQGVLC